ncbi:hypothetical protein DM469_00780 [Lactobacillus helveticus]|uniref:hypothetical protein n=1 Tax=Lactobacillus helveticus TaxID=1587 RepID=UPI000D7C3F41|nr:hypothetical protein [Lactobacillus helveticus]PXZ24335.1 hypothetical protein DM468_01090 [Lactobacillus helveticus]PXZ27659.1 hypothetical protein DM472_00780 [Lactobacillus helveticus]PXZ31462.1 hypothetical protein DM467_00780 [Lactobacillus helveticus]PXZ36237.1 hypothetical protein DM469_00780 [Lactobacillus helveticus]PXZ37811.1 hypothetical protein DM466_00780 [Lactobacillus helveticus]
MYKSRSKNNSHFINAKVVKMMLATMGKTELQAEKDLGWSRTSLKQYLSYKSKLSDNRLNELAIYFNQSSPSYLINYNPTKAQMKVYQEAQIKKAERNKKMRGQNKQTILSANNLDNSDSNSIEIDDTTLNKILDQLVVLTTEINKLKQNERDKQDYLISRIEESRNKDEEIIEILKKISSDSDKRQNYLVGQIKDIKSFEQKIGLNNHFNG